MGSFPHPIPLKWYVRPPKLIVSKIPKCVTPLFEKCNPTL